MKNIFILLFSSTLLLGCFGSGLLLSGKDNKIYNQEKLNLVKKALLLPVNVETDNSSSYSKSITDTLFNDLNSLKSLSIIPMDSASNTAKILNISESDSTFIFKLADTLNADAIIRPSIIYKHVPNMALTKAAMFIMAIYDSHSEKLLAYYSYDTGIGKNYWLKSPTIQQVTNDAISETIKSFEESLHN